MAVSTSYRLYVVCHLCHEDQEVNKAEWDLTFKGTWPVRKCMAGPGNCPFKYREAEP